MLEKDFVPHIESSELKELGFDEPCLFYYYGSNDLQSLIQIDMPRLVNHNESILGTCYSAPSYSQAFRWFREKHNLKSWIQEHTSDTFIYEIRPHVLSDYKQGETYVYTNYEKVELACLKKLIEIIKNK